VKGERHMMSRDDYKEMAAELRRMSVWLDEDPTLCKRAADAIEELLESANEQTSIIRVETPLGALIARPSHGEPDYPGIYIDLRRMDADHDCLLDLIEYTSNEADIEGGSIISRVYGDAQEDEYTDRIVHRGIEDYFRMEEAE